VSELEQGEMHEQRGSRRPPSLDGLTAVFAARPDDPVAGEVWRAAWGPTVQLILVLGVGHDDIDAMPLSPDLELADDDTVSFEPGPPLKHALGAWRSLRSRLPARVLDVRVSAAASDDSVTRILSGAGIGAAVSSVLDERAQLRSVLSDRMTLLGKASWAPERVDQIDIGARIKEVGAKPSALARELGVTPGEITDLARGDRTPSADQATKLAGLLGVPAEQLRVGSLDPELVRALDRPRFRKRLAELGRAEGYTDEAAWRLQVARNELPVAARVTRSKDPRHRWEGLIEDYLSER